MVHLFVHKFPNEVSGSFFLRGYLNSKVYATESTNLEELSQTTIRKERLLAQDTLNNENKF